MLAAGTRSGGGRNRLTRRFLESRDVILDEGRQRYQRVVLERYSASDSRNPDDTAPQPEPTAAPTATAPPSAPGDKRLAQLPLKRTFELQHPVRLHIDTRFSQKKR
jgi:hypothetical protein